MANLYDLGLGNYTFDPTGRVNLNASDPPQEYYKMHWFIFNWVPCRTADTYGCALVERAKLSVEKPSPPLRDQPPPPPSPPPPPPAPPKPRLTEGEKMANTVLGVLKGIDAVSRWLDAPPAPRPPAAPASAAPPAAPAERAIPKFDLQDVPNTMEKINLPVAAKFMRHWFAGRENYSKTQQQSIDGIDQNGKPFEPDMINDSFLTLDWVLRFGEAKKTHTELLKYAIYNGPAAVVIRKRVHAILSCYAQSPSRLSGWVESKRNADALHRYFQFQYLQVETPVVDVALTYLADKYFPVHGVNDLTAALGNFSIYAALGDFQIIRGRKSERAVRVESVYVYVRDSYSFVDKKEDITQYLGHWSTKQIYLAPTRSINKNGVERWIDVPLVDIHANIYDKGAIMYPVTNESFREWREHHHPGGDFLAYTPPQRVALEKPIVVDL